MNYYAVNADFARHRYYYRTEYWSGPARNMAIATRRAISAIMKRKGVKRLRHHDITFHVEKIDPSLVPKTSG